VNPQEFVTEADDDLTAAGCNISDEHDERSVDEVLDELA